MNQAEPRHTGAVLQAFRDFTDRLAGEHLVFTTDRESNEFVLTNLFAFCLGGCIDRRAKSDLVWRVPLFLRNTWGHLDPARIGTLSCESIAAALKMSGCGWQLNLEDVARTILELAQLVNVECDGEVERLFAGTASEILNRLDDLFGVGPGIANMLLIQRVRFFGLRPAGLTVLTVKADTHVVRVFHRTGLSDAPTESSTLAAAAKLTVDERIAADQAAWNIGRAHCRVVAPECSRCVLDAICPKVSLT